MRVGGTFNGTGADLYLCIGFVPDWVHVWNHEATTPIEVVWNKNMMRTAEFVEGMEFQWHATFGSSDATPLTKGNGILTFIGGTVLTSADVGTTTYAEGVYLKPDYRDYRYNSSDTPHGISDAVADTIDTWTLGSATNYTGNFNEDVTGTYIGEGSPICIDGQWYAIVALAAGAGEAANEVTLSHNVASGTVEYIGGMYSTRPMVAGEVTKDGFLISNTTLNANNNYCSYEAGTYDR
jgi:hypothetical protein